ncbi:unnamed protein product [Oncorhynchus mykiss]|uniref:Uncharacterized protein n=1 Tax=Oncorhynchus mykiss TaxID=8022 RepID=A0A060XN00_ONCMY|nr:unnamed protein product [Oncorhynchus mykiss]
MSKLQLFNAYLTERLTAAAAEISVAVERTITDYQEENERLRRLLDLLTKPKFHRAAIYRGYRYHVEAIYRGVNVEAIYRGYW